MSLVCVPPSFRIDAIAHGRGTIGVCACPGGASALEDDLRAVAAFRPDAIVTVASLQELRMLGRADLPEVLPTLAPQWHHLALRVGAAPDARFERIWTYAGHRLRSVLRRGGRVLIHCDDGGARSRWLAARLLAELGTAPADAAAQARAPRLAASAAPDALAEHQLAGRLLGCLFGGAVGDAFGYAVEFRTLAQIQKAHGASGLTEPPVQRGRLLVSDDTQLTLYTADGLLTALAAEGPTAPAQILARIRHAYLAWFRTQREEFASGAPGLSQHRELWALRAPGSTCLAALRAGARGTPQKPANDSRGSGAVMRVAPLGLVLSIDADEAFRLADAAAALTHGHPAARLSAAALAGLIRDLVAETPMTAALDLTIARLERAPGGADVLAAVRAARALAAGKTPPDEAIEKLGQGWNGDEALAIGLYAALRAGSFEEAVRLGANHDGDSDTTAAIAGQIWGALHGLEALPHAWIAPVDVMDALCDVARRLTAHAAANGAAAAPHEPSRPLLRRA